MAKVLLGMSGGVDSSVSLHLLQQSGYEVEGVYMKLHDKDGDGYEKAQKVAAFFDVKLHFVDFQDEFKKNVYNYFIDSYKEGQTPNPCIICNRQIKFGVLIDFAHSLGINKIATGHYTRSDGEFFYEGSDKGKDQSYFLALVDKKAIKNTIFPLANLHKEEVKQIAKKFEILTSIANQKESSEICFVEKSYIDVLKEHMAIDFEGDVLKDGKVVGKHKGYMHYTIGKRRGFSVYGAHEPHFVTHIDAKNNTISVGLKDDLQTYKVVVERLNLFNLLPSKCEVKLRYRTKKLPCKIVQEDNRAYIELLEPAYAVAIGQIAAFYDKEKLLGGGIIVG